MKLISLFVLLIAIALASAAPQKVETRRERKKLDEAVNKLPDTVHKTIKDMHAHGVPKEAIAQRIKHASKAAPASKLVDGVLRRDDPWKAEKSQREAKKRQNKLKNEIRKQERNDRKRKRHGEL
mmetsp:Transcript_9530/g.14339  ORF Transcript_9530/g.14339 Transcript_9530/m.14339 type:complete len:124 (-) Transcript_9530:65-436(-)